MPIVKAGFSAGLHGRASPASWGRRVAYLGREQDQAALLLARDGTISKTGALAERGGKQAEYHEAIIAWTPNECRALAERFGSTEAAKEGIARSIADKLAGDDRHYVVAVHQKCLRTGEQAWHLHVAIQGRQPAQFLGSRGRAQRAVDAAWRECAPKLPIIDWTKHAQFVDVRGELRALQAEQNKLSAERRNALRRARGPAKLDVDKEYASKMQALVERRHSLELAAAQARYDARGIGGGAEHLVEIERADMRRAQALSVIERRSEAVRAAGWRTDPYGPPVALRTRTGRRCRPRYRRRPTGRPARPAGHICRDIGHGRIGGDVRSACTHAGDGHAIPASRPSDGHHNTAGTAGCGESACAAPRAAPRPGGATVCRGARVRCARACSRARQDCDRGRQLPA